MTLTRFALRDFGGHLVATVHARSYAQASALAEQTGLPVNELEDVGPSTATQPRVEPTVTQYLLTLPDAPDNLDEDPTPLSRLLHDLDQQGRVHGFMQDGATLYHLLQLDGAADVQALLHLAHQEHPGATLGGAVISWPTDPLQHAVLQTGGLHVRTGPWA